MMKKSQRRKLIRRHLRNPGVEAMRRTVESLRGFTEDCLEGSRERGILYGVGAYEKGEIKALPAYREAYEMGRAV